MIADEMSWKEIKRKVGEMATMENDMRQAQGSRDHWKAEFKMLEDDVREHYVALPADANGVTIKPGAMVLHGGRTWRVKTLMLTDEREWQLDCHADYGWDDSTVRPEDCTVLEDCTASEPRTVEDVLRGLVEVAEDPRGGRLDDGDIQGFADEIRELMVRQSAIFRGAEPAESEAR